jgi:hypothetical protein
VARGQAGCWSVAMSSPCVSSVTAGLMTRAKPAKEDQPKQNGRPAIVKTGYSSARSSFPRPPVLLWRGVRRAGGDRTPIKERQGEGRSMGYGVAVCGVGSTRSQGHLSAWPMGAGGHAGLARRRGLYRRDRTAGKEEFTLGGWHWPDLWDMATRHHIREDEPTATIYDSRLGNVYHVWECTNCHDYPS